eukprot:SAG11_NODE_681_length_7772_cov_26.403362_8_plen_76_part_00
MRFFQPLPYTYMPASVLRYRYLLAPVGRHNYWSFLATLALLVANVVLGLVRDLSHAHTFHRTRIFARTSRAFLPI